MVRFPHSLVKLALYNSINRHPVQASPLPSFSIVQPEVLVGHVGGQIVRRLEEIGYRDRFVGILERYGQRDEYLETRETHHRLTATPTLTFISFARIIPLSSSFLSHSVPLDTHT